MSILLKIADRASVKVAARQNPSMPPAKPGIISRILGAPQAAWQGAFTAHDIGKRIAKTDFTSFGSTGGSL